MRSFRPAWIAVAGSCLAVALAAQPPVSPAPLTRPTAEATPGPWIEQELRAANALAAGFPATAAAVFREVLQDPALPPAVRPRLSLALVTALLDAGDIGAAEQVLQAYEGPRDAAHRLRAGLLAAYAGRWPQARAALDAGRMDELPAADRAWWVFLQAVVADEGQEYARSGELFGEAAALAGSEQARARMRLAQEQALLRAGRSSEAQLATLRGNMERFQGTRQGYSAARTYAVALHRLGRTAEAEAVLRRQLDVLPPAERESADQLRLVLGLIAGENSETGRRAFGQLLGSAQRPETQRLALRLLARAARTPVERRDFRSRLTGILHDSPQHAIAEDILLSRALVGLVDGLYAGAEEDARALLERYPGSPLRPAALGVRLSVAWEMKRYRAVADVVAQLRALLPDGAEKAELGVLLAEAFFRAGDYPSAAAAYDAALREAPAVAPAGMLIFQRVLSEINAGRPEAGARLLDEAAANPAFDAESRWRAEWNLVKHLQVRGEAETALGRVERLLAAGPPGVPGELRVRLLWLQADLSFDLERYEPALRLADALLATVPAAGDLEPGLREQVLGNTLLLKGQVLLMLGREDEGTKVLEELRATYLGSAAWAYSFIVQAARLSRHGQLAEAQKVLTDLADSVENFIGQLAREMERPGGIDAGVKPSGRIEDLRRFATLALYEAALNAERQGLERNLLEAHNLLERIKRDHPGDELRFYAMLKQGDLLRQLNDFAAARQVYEEILINYAQHQDILLAQLALADTLFALGPHSVVNYESAAALFERLRDLPTAPVDLRAEAGFKWGYALARRGGAADRAVSVLWSVVDGFLLNPATVGELGAKGRYWVSRALLELGQLHEDAGRRDEAQRAYTVIVERRLGGAAQAQAKLERYRAEGAPASSP